MDGQMNEWIFAPEVWLMIGVGLFLLECCFDTFYLGGAAAGAALTAVGLLVLQRGAEADPAYDGLPFMIWGLATLASCAVLRLVCRGSGDDPPDVNQRRYRGEE